MNDAERKKESSREKEKDGKKGQGEVILGEEKVRKQLRQRKKVWEIDISLNRER